MTSAPAEPAPVQAAAAALAAVWPGARLEWVAETDSTNTQLLQRARAGELGAPTLLVAERQTQGRGRLGRAWHSRAGESLTFSLALPYAPRAWEGLSLAVGAALAEALEPVAPASTPRLRLKWPNDLWLCEPAAPGTAAAGRKLGGILIETVAGPQGRVLVVGVGLNLAQRLALEAADAAAREQPVPGQPTPSLAHGHAGLHALHPGLTPAQALARVAGPLAQALARFAQAGLAPWLPVWAQRDLLAGQAVATHGEPMLQGVAEGVAADGALQLRTPDGRLHRVASGEVSVRLQAAPAAAEAG